MPSMSRPNARMAFTHRAVANRLYSEPINLAEKQVPTTSRDASAVVTNYNRMSLSAHCQTERWTSLAGRQRRQNVLGGLARRHSGASLFDPTPSGQSPRCNPITAE